MLLYKSLVYRALQRVSIFLWKIDARQGFVQHPRRGTLWEQQRQHDRPSQTDNKRMEILQKKNEVAAQVLWQQPWREDVPLRFLTYCLALPYDEGLLLYNVLHKELLFLDRAEAATIVADDLNASPLLRQTENPLFAYLYTHWYLVPVSHDDRTLCLHLRAIARQLHEARPTGQLRSFTILTTTDCNARCFYCYERGCKYENMSRATAYKVLDYIKRQCTSGRVFLSWFGGEPLYNREPIDIITRGLEEAGIQYLSTMTTNGYLFDEALVRAARERWHLVRVQITLDGTEEVYNRRKAYIYKGVNAFARVTDNIELLLRAAVRVIVRLNLDARNYADLTTLADYLSARYGQYRRYYAYAHCIDYSHSRYATCHDDRTLLTERVSVLNERLRPRRGIPVLDHRIAMYHCMADNPAAVLIQTDGALGKCEHYFNSRQHGTVDGGVSDSEELRRTQQPDIDPPRCTTCPLYPSCIRLALCPSSFANGTGRTEVECADEKSRTQEAMLACYDRTRTHKG